MRKTNEKKINNKGITLIALIVTIIVLLILAGVSIAMLTGQNGILTQANNSKIEQSHGAVKEAISLAYNEWQIEVNTGSRTKLASTETVIINGEEEKAKVGTFLQFLESKGYIKEDTTDILDVKKLTGSKQVLGNGEDTDIYKIELKDGNYEVNYYDENGGTRNIWSVASANSQESATLEPDTGKESLILVYKVKPGDTIQLPYYDIYYVDANGENEYPANFDFNVDWGDGQTDTITTDNISEKAIHTYENLDTEKEIKVSITGIFESLFSNDIEGIDKLVKVEQWGTTEIKSIALVQLENLKEIAEPTESSFKDLLFVSFLGSGITSIPDKMFMNCTKITNFDLAFYQCNNLTTIGEHIFEGCDNVQSYKLTFFECYNLTGKAPELWLKVLNGEENNYIGIPDGEKCFGSCEKLENYDDIPEYWRKPRPV